jgi:heat shock protein HslJ
MSTSILPALLVVFIVAACGGAAPTPSASASVTPGDPAVPPSIEGAWQGVTVAGQPVVVGHEPMANFGPGEVSGTTGCNSFGGSYTYADGKILFGPLRTTLMACIGPIGEVEGRFSAALAGATTVTTDAQGHLVIDGTGGSIVFIGLPT